MYIVNLLTVPGVPAGQGVDTWHGQRPQLSFAVRRPLGAARIGLLGAARIGDAGGLGLQRGGGQRRPVRLAEGGAVPGPVPAPALPSLTESTRVH